MAGMKLVVADTGPVRYVIVLELVDVLPALFSRVILPPAVLGEFSHPHAPEAVRRWATRGGISPRRYKRPKPTTSLHPHKSIRSPNYLYSSTVHYR